jgi:hypothetical protein
MSSAVQRRAVLSTACQVKLGPERSRAGDERPMARLDPSTRIHTVHLAAVRPRRNSME